MNPEEERLKKEKGNKKIALVIMIFFCALFGVMGVVGGVYKFIKFVDEMNPSPDEVLEDKCTFYKDGVLTFCVNGSPVSTYTCQKSCGWAFGLFENPPGVELITPSVETYSYNYLIDDNYAIIYDGEDDGSGYYRSAGVKIIPLHDQDKSKIVSLASLTNYGNKGSSIFIAENDNNKWGVIKLESSGITELVKYNYDYIGIFVPDNETINDQLYYAALSGKDWLLVSIEGKGNEVASNTFSSPIAAYDLRLVVTKEQDGTYTVRNLNGEVLTENQKNYYFTGLSVLCVYDDNSVTVYNTYTGSELLHNTYAEVTEVKYLVQDGEKIEFTIGDQKEVVQGKKNSKSGIGISGN